MQYCQILQSRVSISSSRLSQSIALLTLAHFLDYADSSYDPLRLLTLAAQQEQWFVKKTGHDIFLYLPSRTELSYLWIDSIAPCIEQGSFVEALDLTTLEVYRIVWAHGEPAQKIYPIWRVQRYAEV